MTSKADYQAAAKLLSDLAAAQPDDVVVPPPPPPPPPPPADPFLSKKYYPAKPTLNVLDAAFDPAAGVVHVQVALDRPNPTTVEAQVGTSNGTLSASAHYKATTKELRFSPGDPLVQTAAVPVYSSCPAGGTFKVDFNGTLLGFNRGRTGIITCTPGAPATVPMTTGFRPMRTFDASGEPSFNLDIPNMKWKDKGGPGVWDTALPHGRTQPSPGQTGLYADLTLWPGIEPPHAIINGKLVLHSQRFAIPQKYDEPAFGTLYQWGASVLTGLQIPETHFLYGKVEIEALMPDRRGSWPALWFLGRRPLSGGKFEGIWPPEFDLMEGFNHSVTFYANSMTSCAIHGGEINEQSFSGGGNITAARGGFAPDLAKVFHKYQADIQPDFITVFMDGLEIFQFINPFRSYQWFPLLNVGVKTNDSTAAYDGGSGDMTISAYKMWRS